LETKTQPESQFDDRTPDALRQYNAPDFEQLTSGDSTGGKDTVSVEDAPWVGPS